MYSTPFYKLEENEEDDWFYEDGTSIQCCLCGKWRFLGEISENDITSLEYWDCSMNTDTRLIYIFCKSNYLIEGRDIGLLQKSPKFYKNVF